MIVDCHAHVIVPEIAPQAAPPPSAVREFTDVEAIVAEQDAAGIERTLLSPWVNLLGTECEAQNRALEGLVGERIAALGTVDLGEPEAAAGELRALMGRGRLAGVEVPASADGRYLGEERFAPFWAAAEETGALVFVHPTTRGIPVPDEQYLWNTVGNPVETAIAAAHLACAGVLDRHPRLRILLSHGGGAIAPLRGRLTHAWSLGKAAAAAEPALRRLYYDTVVHDAAVLRDLVDWVGADHVLLGSDRPFDMGDERPAEVVRALGLPAADQERILGVNARELLDG